MDNSVKDLQNSLSIIGDKWSLVILMHLHQNGPMRFSECQKQNQINSKTLAQRLVSLEESGLISKKEYQEYPPRTEYEITETGRTLAPIFEELADWGKEHLTGEPSTQSKPCD